MGKTANPVDIYDFEPCGTDQALTVSSAEGGVKLAALPAIATHGFVTVALADVMLTLDDSAPTTTNGHIIKQNHNAIWPVSWLNAAKFIRQAATDATVHVTPLLRSGALR